MKNNNLNWRDRRSLKNVSKDAKIQLTDGTFLDAIAIAKIVDMAPEDLDTMKEIADWISNHEEEVVSILEGLDSKADKSDLEALAEVVDTKATKDEVNSKYSKPTGGIPKSDLTTDVQLSLNKADTALQSHQDISNLATKTEVNAKYTKPSAGIPKSDLTNAVQASLNKADSALQNHQDISHLATKEEVENKLSEINNTKLDVNLNTITKTGEDKIKELVNADEMYNNASNAIVVANNQIKEVSKLKNDVETYIGAGKEQVVVSITSSVEGVSVSGLTLYVYLNNAETPIEATTDENGMATFRVDVGYKYRIVFPRIDGCEHITDVTHTASVAQRSVEVEYTDVKVMYENLTVRLVHFTSSYIEEDMTGNIVKVTIDGEIKELLTNSAGTVTVRIPIGKEYRIELPKIDGFYIRENKYVYNLTAEMSSRFILGHYTDFESGVFIICDNGMEYLFDDFKAKNIAPEDARMIKISTVSLANNSENDDEYATSVFCISIDEIRQRVYPSKMWNSGSLDFTSVDTGCHYNGYKNCQLLYNEGLAEAKDTPAIEYALQQKFVTSAKSYNGFLGSVYQWVALWNVREEIDEILDYTRPLDGDGNFTHRILNVSKKGYDFSSYTGNKWTSDQSHANNAYYFGSGVGSNIKNNGYAAVPFYAF